VNSSAVIFAPKIERIADDASRGTLEPVGNGMSNMRSRPSDAKLLFAKRAFDIVFSCAALVVLFPIFLVVAISIKMDSPGPILFTQTRWGKDGREIRVLKFRSMRYGAGDVTGVRQTVKSDPRITRVGRFLRSFNLDEIPQFFNILMGDMAVVGPRCHAIGMRAGGIQYEDLVPSYHQRHSVRPGLTGLAQIRGLRGPTDRPSKARARIACDIYYVNNFSLWLDLYIVAKTIANEARGGTGF
jgi:lipopolysaccharide/colanic/teichoic acid biosynthesis glycosyltransferase